MVSVLASHPAAPGSILGVPERFFPRILSVALWDLLLRLLRIVDHKRTPKKTLKNDLALFTATFLLENDVTTMPWMTIHGNANSRNLYPTFKNMSLSWIIEGIWGVIKLWGMARLNVEWRYVERRRLNVEQLEGRTLSYLNVELFERSKKKINY